VTVRGALLREMGLPAPYAESRPLEIAELTLDPPGPGELLIRVGAAGLCHSDLSVIDGSRPRVMPMVLGHEAAGEVVEVGADVSRFAPGDHVVLAFLPTCGTCACCTSDRAWLCETGGAANAAGSLLSGERRLHDASGATLHHHLGVSGFADHVVVSERSAVGIPDDLPYEIAALFGCAVLTGVGAALNAAQVAAGDSVAVFGLGGVGLAALLGAKVAGAGQIVAVDVVADKLALARELGATDVVTAGPDAVEEIRALTGGGPQRVIETVGNADVLAQAYAATRRGGTTVTVGLPHPDRMLTIPAVSLVTEEKTLRGSYLGSCDPSRDIPRFVALYRDGKLPVDRLLTHRIALDEVNEGFDRLARGEAVRQAIVF
jgi:alcohol dehydrogenase